MVRTQRLLTLMASIGYTIAGQHPGSFRRGENPVWDRAFIVGEPLTCAVLGNAGESAGRHVLQQREVGRERFITATLSVVSSSSDFPIPWTGRWRGKTATYS